MSRLVEYERTDGIVTITLNRPEKLNALSPEMLRELCDAWTRYRDDGEAKVAIFTGAGRAFTAGADLSWFERSLEGEDHLGPFLDVVQSNPYWSGRLDKPTIVAVKGWVIGAGFDLALRADLRVAAESATFWMPEVGRGNIVPIWDNVPYAIAAEIMSGFPIPARRAYEVGLVNRLVGDDALLDTAGELAEELASRPVPVLRHALRTIRELKNSPFGVSLESMRLYTNELSKNLMTTEQRKQAVDALLAAKRTDSQRSERQSVDPKGA